VLDQLGILRSRAHEFIHNAHQFGALIVLRRLRPRLGHAGKLSNGGCKSSGTTAMTRYGAMHDLRYKAPRLRRTAHGK
jgi:hypothetical protein